MKRDLPYYIARFLLVRPELNIPGFGRFYSSYKSAFFAENEIHPPAYSREFSPHSKASDLDDFCDFLKYQTGRGEAYIKKTVKDFITELKKGAKSKAGIPIEGLGTFTSKNGKIHGEIDNHTFGHYFSGFPNVDTQVLGSLIKDPASARTEDKAVQAKEDEEAIVTAVPPGIALNTAEDSATSTPDKSDTQQEFEENVPKEKVVETEKKEKFEEQDVSVPVPIVVPADHTSVKTVPVPVAQKSSFTQTITAAAPSQIHSRRSGKVGPNSQNSRSLFWLLGLILLLLVISAFLLLTDVLDGGSKTKYSQEKKGTAIESEEGNISGSGSDQQSTKDIRDELESSLTPISGSKQGSTEAAESKGETVENTESGIDKSKAGEAEPNSKTEMDLHESGKSEPIKAETGIAVNLPGKGKDCMVVVGAFRVLSNVDRMEAKLKQMGYQPYTEVRKGLTHVGVLTPCRTSELRNVLYRGRAEIDGGTWVMRVHGTAPN